MTTIIIFVIAAAVIIGIGSILQSSNETPSAPSPQNGFTSLGDMTGKSKAEIIAAAGPPTSISAIIDGQLLQWINGGYHIAIKFDSNGIFAGITHEANVTI